MSKVKFLSIVVVFLLVIDLVMVAFMFLKRPGEEHGIGMALPQERPKNIVINELHFDEEQVLQYEKLITKHQTDVRAFDDSIRATKNSLFQTLASTEFLGKDSLVNILSSLQRKIEVTHYDHFVAIKNLCKPEQLADFNQLADQLADIFDRRKNNLPPPKD